MHKQVLVLDDNPVQLLARQRVLAQAGFEVHVETNAEIALSLLNNETFRESIGAIVTDHIMPQVSGHQFVQILREITPDVPIIVISGMAEAENEYQEFQNVDFRTKPVPPQELIDLVKSRMRQ
jgi:DNA-binding NtrC family response regulator